MAAMLLLAVQSGAPGAASAAVLGAAGVTQPWLGLGTDVRDAALGGAVGTLAQGNGALQDNPAGLDSLLEPELSLAHNEWNTDLGIREESLAYGRRFWNGAAAGSFRYFSYGSFDNRDASGASLGSSNDDAYAGTLGYGQSVWSDDFKLGAALSGSQEVLSGQATNLYALSLGMLYQGPWGFRAAAATLNQKLSGTSADPGPGANRLALGWANRGHSLQFDADWLQPVEGDGTFSVGGEWILAGDYSLRAGWRFAQGEGSELEAGPSLGAGLQLGAFRIDYAFVPYGVLGNTQQIGATFFLNSGFFGGNIVIDAAGSSQEAQSFYSDGMAAYKAGDWGEAKVSLQHALKLKPDLPQGAEARRTIQEADQRIAQIMVDIRAEATTQALAGAKPRPGSPETAAIYTLFAKKQAEASLDFKQGNLSAAKEKLEEIFQFDPGQRDAQALKRQVDEALNEKVAALTRQGADALAGGDLAGAVASYRQVLKLNADDKEIRDILIKLSPKVVQEVRRLHLLGVDAYVNDDLDRAISVWQQALDLDPADPNNIRRDIDRAKKIRALRAN
jgi:tetratricopeptide (TPR) repeat protein